ncbi:hypothetical protein [Hyphococcus sp.]|uniref:hypothetical protein n=1 Tax=Hyphococcus sp. TaxID=2038636 RepID=UPI003D0B70CE
MAAPLTGGVTVVQPTADLGALGLSASPLGDASINSNGFFEFPITGGDLDGLAGGIEHDNSGVSLTNGTDVLDLENFLIDTTTQQIFGDVSLNSAFVANAPIFSFNVAQLSSIDSLFDLSNPSLELLFTATAAGVLFDVYGASGLEGAVFGLAATAPEIGEVPIPAAFGLFAAGAAGLGWLGRRRRLS